MTKWFATLIALCSLSEAAAAQVQSFPSKPVTIVVTAAAGGLTDVVSRAVGQRLGEIWGQQIVIENKGGAGHNIGAAAVARAAPDGYTLMASEAGTFVINPNLQAKGKLPYDADTDFVPVSGLVRNYQTMVVHPSLPANTMGELIALLTQKPGEISYGTAGLGTAPHMTIVALENLSGVKLIPVHYRGAGPALNDLIGGHVKLMSISAALALQPFKAGQIRALAVGSRKRLPQFEGVPTLSESWVPDYEAALWFGLFSPRGTPRETVATINADVQRVLADPSFQEKFLAPQLLEPMMGSPDQLAEFVKTDSARWAKVIRDANLKID